MIMHKKAAKTKERSTSNDIDTLHQINIIVLGTLVIGIRDVNMR